MKTTKLNILFLCCIIFSLVIIAIINYIGDPYEIFHTRNRICILNEKNIYDLHLKKQKHATKGIMFLGGSELDTLFNLKIYNKYYFDKIIIKFSNYEQYYPILEKYLEIFPNTKHVYVVISYSKLYDSYTTPLNTSLLNKIYCLFLSKESFFQSIKNIKNKILKIEENEINIKEINHNNFIENNPDKIFPMSYNSISLKTMNEKATADTYKLIKLLESKNIYYTIIIPPYSSIYIANIFLFYKEIYEYIEKYKMFLATHCKNVYDFAIINKYTNENIYKADYLYSTPDHPNFIFGIKLFKVFFDKDNAEQDIYIVLNKNNAEKELTEQRKKIENFINNNEELVETYRSIELRKNNNKFISKYRLTDIPENYKNEIYYLKNKEKEKLQGI